MAKGFGRITTVPTYSAAPHPLNRQAINEPMVTGIRVIDGLLTPVKGPRMGIFAGSGVGKSVLMGSIARSTKADISVIALVGGVDVRCKNLSIAIGRRRH
jgi:flagellar biosynthesis/type III secretory pathway ATPase